MIRTAAISISSAAGCGDLVKVLVARRRGDVAVCQAAGPRPVRMALGEAMGWSRSRPRSWPACSRAIDWRNPRHDVAAERGGISCQQQQKP